MTGVSMGHSKHRPQSAENTLRRCRNNENDNVILIDADSESFDYVILVDTPESFPKRKVGSGKFSKDKWSCENIINIDDDENPDNNHSGDVNSSSNREPCHRTTNFADSTDAGGEKCQYVQDNNTPVRLSKCRRTYSGKTSRSNHHGLNIDSESDSSVSDYPDCELVESGKVQELWEKASFRRRSDTHNGPSGIRDHGSTSQNLSKDQRKNSGMEDGVRQQKEAAFCFRKVKPYNEDDLYTFRNQDSGFGCSRVFDDPTELDLSQSAPETDLHNDVNSRSNSESKSSPSVYTEQVDLSDCGLSDSDIEETEECLASSYFTFGDDHQTLSFMDVKACPPTPGSCVDEDPCSEKSSPIDNLQNFKRDDDSVQENEHLATGSANEMDNFIPGKCSYKGSTSLDSQTNPSSSPSCNAVRSFPGQSLFSEHFLASEDAVERDHHLGNKQQFPEISSCVNPDLNQNKLQEDDSLSNSHQENKDGWVVHIPKADTLPYVETSIINEREIIKETDEYKRATEAEWASRKQALAIQAEEAQRLRRLHKRRKAESMRMLDMERRQKQRLEEIRNTQKKDEENMNLKEKIRAEVRNELTKLETKSQNMASLLQLLGVHVNGWPCPSPQQVQAAYKKALLTFHPDRALQSDMHLQVEAEEKFKLINRMKEKFLPFDMAFKN